MQSNQQNKNEKKPIDIGFFSILKMIFDLALYVLIGYCLIVIIGQIFHLFEVIGWLFPLTVGIIASAYCFRKFLIFLILRKK